MRVARSASGVYVYGVLRYWLRWVCCVELRCFVFRVFFALCVTVPAAAAFIVVLAAWLVLLVSIALFVCSLCVRSCFFSGFQALFFRFREANLRGKEAYTIHLVTENP